MCLISRNEWSPNGGNVICQKVLLFNGVFFGEAYGRTLTHGMDYQVR